MVTMVGIYPLYQSNKFNDLTCGVCQLPLDSSVSKAIDHLSMFVTASKRNTTICNEKLNFLKPISSNGDPNQPKPRSYKQCVFDHFGTHTPQLPHQKKNQYLFFISFLIFTHHKKLKMGINTHALYQQLQGRIYNQWMLFGALL